MKIIMSLAFIFYSSGLLAAHPRACQLLMVDIVQKADYKTSPLVENISNLESIIFPAGEYSVSFKGTKGLAEPKATCWVTYYMNKIPPTKGGCPFDGVSEVKVHCK